MTEDRLIRELLKFLREMKIKGRGEAWSDTCGCPICLAGFVYDLLDKEGIYNGRTHSKNKRA